MLNFKKLSAAFMSCVIAGLFAGTASAVNEKIVPWLAPDSDVGNKHIVMYQLFVPGATDPSACLGCHQGNNDQPVAGPKGPPTLGFFGVNMQDKKDDGRACISCHKDGLFLWSMTDDPDGGKGGMSNLRCEDCHEVIPKPRTVSGKNDDDKSQD